MIDYQVYLEKNKDKPKVFKNALMDFQQDIASDYIKAKESGRNADAQIIVNYYNMITTLINICKIRNRF